MPDSSARWSAVHSVYADDPDFQDLLALFYESLASQRVVLESAFRERRWDELSRMAHQLKGSGGGFGFPELSQAALALETACASAPLEIPARFGDLCTWIDRILRP